MADYILNPFASAIHPSTKVVKSAAVAATSNHTFTFQGVSRSRRIAITTIAAGLTAADGDLAITFTTLDSDGTTIGSATGTDRYGNATTETNKAIGNKVWEILDICADNIVCTWTKGGTESTGTIQIYVSLLEN